MLTKITRTSIIPIVVGVRLVRFNLTRLRKPTCRNLLTGRETPFEKISKINFASKLKFQGSVFSVVCLIDLYIDLLQRLRLQFIQVLIKGCVRCSLLYWVRVKLY